MRHLSIGLLLLTTIFCSNLFAVSGGDSIINIPQGTIFKLKYELEAPANQNFLYIGGNQLQESFNEINQMFNQQNNNQGHNYLHYNQYLGVWMESANKSYTDCLERHRTYYSTSSDASNNTVINNGNGNTSIIINNQQNSGTTYGSYIDQNTCIKPEHTIAVLLLNKDKTKAGGIFREDYEFRVKSVNYRKTGHFYTINILFDHKVAKGLRILTTQPPKTIPISSLQAAQSTTGFWNSFGSALASLTDIGGNHFDILLPDLEYFD